MNLFSLTVALMLPFTAPTYEVTVEQDVPYATAMGYWSHAPVGDKKATGRLLLHSGRRKPLTLEMDIYTPVGDDSDAKRPLLLMMHGGSFFIGHKDEPGQAGWCRYFASLGYVAVSIDYRLGYHASRNEFREAELRALEDADAALDYLLRRENLRIDPGRIFVAGTSAGAITALNLAFGLYGDKPMDRVKPLRDKDFRIRAVANLWGAVHDLSILENASVAILSFQSEKDPMVPYDYGYPMGKTGRLISDPIYGTHAIYEKALEIGLRAEHHPCPEARHRLHLDDEMKETPRFYEIRDAMVKFFAEQME